MNLEIPGASSQSIATSAASTEQDELSQRLARLRETWVEVRAVFSEISLVVIHKQDKNLTSAFLDFFFLWFTDDAMVKS